MKLFEVLDKREDALTKVKLLRRKADRRNSKSPTQNKHNTRGAEDSFTGAKPEGFADANW